MTPESLRDVRVRPYVVFIAATLDTDFDPRPEAIWVGGQGDVEVIDIDGNQTIITAVPAGTILQIRPVRIVAALTTATLMTLLF